MELKGMNISILYEDENYVVLNKPAGLVVHPAYPTSRFEGSKEEYFLSDWLLENYPEVENVGEPLMLDNGIIVKRPGIVHRLDKETSGVIALAKNQEAYKHLKGQFKNRKVQKIYKTFVQGVLKKDKALIERPIGRSSKFGLWSAGRGVRGKVREAQTEYKVLKRGTAQTFLEVIPKTGRTHQIRVHFKAINYPVVCDKFYNPKTPCALGFERLALHAESLRFKGLAGKEVSATAPLPEDFLAALKNIAE